jgi:hypothetical protein
MDFSDATLLQLLRETLGSKVELIDAVVANRHDNHHQST